MAKKKPKIAAPDEPVAESPAAAKAPASPNDARKYLVFAGLAALCLAIYAQTAGFDFVNLDDDSYVFQNANVLKGLGFAGLKWAFTTFYAANWHPLTWLSHQFDASLFGADAAGPHVVNLLLHLANSLILFAVVNRLTKAFWKSALVAAIFAVHPAHVESVAWIAERKDVLSTLFWFLSTLAYLHYAGDISNRKAYWLAVALFALGLAAKPMLVTLPFTLILLDYWALERFERWSAAEIWPLVREKLPFFGLAAISAVVTVFAQKAGGAIQTAETIPFSARIPNALAAYVKYVAMLFYPAGLGVWYPFDASIGWPVVAASAVLLAAVTFLVLRQIRARKYLFVGWFWFLGTLVPVIGLVQVGRQSMADRYTYVPYVGLSIMIVWLGAEIFARLRLDARIAGAVCAVFLLILTVVAFRQAAFWKTSETLFTRTLSVTGKNYLIKNNFCNYLEKKNRLDEASAQCLAAIADDPALPDAYNTLAAVRIKQGKFDDAQANLERALAVRPDFALAYMNLAVVATNRSDFDAASENLAKATANDRFGYFDPSRLLDAYAGIAVAALKQQRYDKAVEFFQKSIELAPNNTDYQRNLALALHKTGRSAEGIRMLEEAIRKNPNLPEVYNTLGLIYIEQKRQPEAVAQFQKALQIDPNFTPAQGNLRKAMEQK